MISSHPRAAERLSTLLKRIMSLFRNNSLLNECTGHIQASFIVLFWLLAYFWDRASHLTQTGLELIMYPTDWSQTHGNPAASHSQRASFMNVSYHARVVCSFILMKVYQTYTIYRTDKWSFLLRIKLIIQVLRY